MQLCCGIRVDFRFGAYGDFARKSHSRIISVDMRGEVMANAGTPISDYSRLSVIRGDQ